MKKSGEICGPTLPPPEAAVGKEGEAPKAGQPEQPKREGGSDIEEKELKEDGVIPE